MRKLISLFFTVSFVLAQTNIGQFGIIDQLPPYQPGTTQSGTSSLLSAVPSINLTGNFKELVIVVGFSDKNHNYPTLNTNNNYPLCGTFPDGTLLKDYVAQHGNSIPADEWFRPAFNYYFTELSGGLYNVNFNFVKNTNNGGTYLSNHTFSYWITQNGNSDNSVIIKKYPLILSEIADQLYSEDPDIYYNVSCIHFVFVGVSSCEFFYRGSSCAGGTINNNFALKSVDGSTTYWTGPVSLQSTMAPILHERLHIIGAISNYPPTGNISTGFIGFPDRGSDKSPGESYHNLSPAYDIMFHDGSQLPPLHSLYGLVPLTTPDLIFLGWIKPEEIETINASNYSDYSAIKLADWSNPLTQTQINEGLRRIVKVMIHANYDGFNHDEYFLAEYHNASGLDKAFENFAEFPLTGYNKGVLIWHIKEKANMLNQNFDNLARLLAAVPYNGWNGNPIPDNQFRTDYTRDPNYNGVKSGEYNYMDDAFRNPSKPAQFLYMQDGGQHIWETTVINDLGNKYSWDPTGNRLFFRLQSLSSDFFSDQSIKGHISNEITDVTRPSTRDWGKLIGGVPVAYKTHIAITDITSQSGHMTLRVYYNYWTGNITENTTISGNAIIGGNLTINSGATLTVEPGATINFAPNTSLIVNGSLIAEGTSASPITFDFVQKNNNGIKINAPGSLISNAIIKNAYMGIEVNNVQAQIEDCEIFNCNYGIGLKQGSANILQNRIHDCACGVYLYRTAYAPELPVLESNEFYNMTNYAIWANNYCSPKLKHNYFHDNYRSVYLYYHSSIYYDDMDRTGGYNRFSNNTVAIVASNYSNIYQSLGYYSLNGNVYNLSILGYSWVDMRFCWWGSNPPDPNKFNVSANSSLSYAYWLTGDPFNQAMPMANLSAKLTKENVNSPSQVGDNLISVKTEIDIFKEMQNLIGSKNNLLLRSQCKDFITARPQSKFAPLVLTIYSNTFLGNENNSELIDYLKSFYSKTRKDQLSFTAGMILADQATENKDRLYDELLRIFSGEPICETILFNKLCYKLHQENNKVEANMIFSKLASEFPGSEAAENAQLLFGLDDGVAFTPMVKSSSEDKKISDDATKEYEYELIGNYPNPFNPSTVIKYSLKDPELVTLKVYDILGREVSVLVNESQSAGVYQVTFDGENLSSGIYFYTLSAGRFIKTGKMLLSK